MLSFAICSLNDASVLQNYEAFFDAREDNAVYAFLGLTAPPGSKVGVLTDKRVLYALLICTLCVRSWNV